MLCLSSFNKFLKKMATNSQNKLYNIIFTTHALWWLFWADVISPSRYMWWLLPAVTIGNYLIDSGVLLLGMVMFQAQNQGISYLHVWKKSSVLVFVFGLIADFIGFLITDWFYYPELRVLFNGINGKVVPADLSWFNTVGAGLLGASITCIIIYVLNRYVSFRHCEMDNKFKLKLAIFIAVLTTPWYFAL